MRRAFAAFSFSGCWVALALVCILGVTAIAWTRPFLGWDLLPYVAIVHSWTDPAGTDTHEAAYADAARFAAAHRLEEQMTILQKGRYRVTMATDAAAFEDQLPFYRIRPLYLAIVTAAATLTATVSEATMLVTVGSFFACCIIVLWYGVRRAGVVAGSIASGLFALAPPATQAARLSTPDTLTMLLMTVAAIAFARGRLVAAASLLAVGVLIRTDLEVFNVCLAGAWLMLAWRRPGSVLVAGILASSVAISAAVNAWAGSYGYAGLYRFTFMEGNVPHPASLRGLGFPFGSLLPNIEAGVKYSLENGGLWMVLALLGLCVTLLARASAGERRDEGPMCEALLVAVGLSTCVRFVLFPELDLRLVAPAAAVLTVVLLTIGGRRRVVAA